MTIADLRITHPESIAMTTFTVIRLPDGWAVQKSTPRQVFVIERGFFTEMGARQYAEYLRRQASRD